MIAGAMQAGIMVCAVGATLWLAGLLVFVTETGRLPGTRRRWEVYQRAMRAEYGQKAGIEVGVQRKSNRMETAFIYASAEEFESLLSTAVTEARLKAMALNDEHRHARMRLPG